MASSMSSQPEQYALEPTTHVPNSTLPVLVYRSVLPPEPNKRNTREAIETNHWYHGGDWKAYKAHHFHSVTHECYAVYRGRSTLLLGRGPLDENGGLEVVLEAGDVIVLPAGVSHCSLDSEGDYSYAALYPEGSPHWDNNWCKASREETDAKAEVAHKVPVPGYDPIYGQDGPLVHIWNNAWAEKDP